MYIVLMHGKNIIFTKMKGATNIHCQFSIFSRLLVLIVLKKQNPLK